ncbi:uncharacterized protein PAC_00201 [Phialocephala subalpina]|uniref:Major facilitator superfamily (MFS) profile domain-containing protein n=1 Tax=Phialocephala subalpina TaxID=576137 RepID=A0A1L7WCC8_9HELO|nr:uncharacterized protein PAC_00201 [Phialocephala subalpina]
MADKIYSTRKRDVNAWHSIDEPVYQHQREFPLTPQQPTPSRTSMFDTNESLRGWSLGLNHPEQENYPPPVPKKANTHRASVRSLQQPDGRLGSLRFSHRPETWPTEKSLTQYANCQSSPSWDSRSLQNPIEALRNREDQRKALPAVQLQSPRPVCLSDHRSQMTESNANSWDIEMEKLTEPTQRSSTPESNFRAGFVTEPQPHGLRSRISSFLAESFRGLYRCNELESNSTEWFSNDIASYPRGFKLFFILLSGALPYVVVVLDDTVVGISSPDFCYTGSQAYTCYLSHAAVWEMLRFMESEMVICKCVSYHHKLTLVTLFCIFDLTMIVGSAVSAAAHSSSIFITGRAIAGAGAAGIITGAMRIIALAAPRKYRVFLEAAGAIVMGACTVSGPILGGVIADSIGWRWSFWINIPIAAFSAVAFLICFPKQEVTYSPLLHLPFREKLRRLDLIGAFLLISGLICLTCLFQSLSTSTRLTNSGKSLSVAAAIFLAGFLIHAWFINSEISLAPRRILSLPAVWICCIGLFSLFAGFINFIFFLSIFFQSVDGQSAQQSAISLLPYAFAVSVGAVITGLGVSKVRYYNPFFIVGGLFFAVGAGLIRTFDATTATRTRVGYEIILGLGVGFLMLGNVSACQTSLEEEHHSVAQGLTLFCSLLGSTVSVPVSSTIFNRVIATQIMALDLPLVVKAAVLSDPTKAHEVVPIEYLPIVVDALVVSLKNTFIFGLSCSLICAVAFYLVPWTPLMASQNARSQSPPRPAPKLPPLHFSASVLTLPYLHGTGSWGAGEQNLVQEREERSDGNIDLERGEGGEEALDFTPVREFEFVGSLIGYQGEVAHQFGRAGPGTISMCHI